LLSRGADPFLSKQGSVAPPVASCFSNLLSINDEKHIILKSFIHEKQN
jgi:hypothetical protein